MREVGLSSFSVCTDLAHHVPPASHDHKEYGVGVFPTRHPRIRAGVTRTRGLALGYCPRNSLPKMKAHDHANS